MRGLLASSSLLPFDPSLSLLLCHYFPITTKQKTIRTADLFVQLLREPLYYQGVSHNNE